MPERDRPIALAGLWTEWTDPQTGEQVTSHTVITCPPNDLMAQYHNRMPVIFPSPDAEGSWLSPGLESEDALELCVPFPPERMESAPANPELNKVGGAEEGPGLLVAPA